MFDNPFPQKNIRDSPVGNLSKHWQSRLVWKPGLLSSPEVLEHLTELVFSRLPKEDGKKQNTEEIKTAEVPEEKPEYNSFGRVQTSNCGKFALL
jgi:hypothetical protein